MSNFNNHFSEEENNEFSLDFFENTNQEWDNEDNDDDDDGSFIGFTDKTLKKISEDTENDNDFSLSEDFFSVLNENNDGDENDDEDEELFSQNSIKLTFEDEDDAEKENFLDEDFFLPEKNDFTNNNEGDNEDSNDEDSLKNYVDSFNEKPDAAEKRRNLDLKKTTNKLSGEDYRLIITQETVKGIDLIDTDIVHKEITGTHKNKATKKRAYDRGDKGILSKMQIEYFTSLSRKNLSNARYPDEYMNLVRSNEELLDYSELAHKRIIRDSVSVGVNDKSRENVAEYIPKMVTRKDEEILEVLAKLKYASTRQISRAVGRSYENTRTSLRKMKYRKLVKNPDSPYYDQKLWCVTDLGMIFSGLDMGTPDLSGISVAMLQHTTVVNNVAAFIHSGSVNVLDEEPFPPRRRITKNGRVVHGENFVSETQIRSSLGKLTSAHSIAGTKGDIYIPIIKDKIDEEFTRWEKLREQDPYLHSPERELGNEYMWVIYPPARIGSLQHIPDLVVPRDRNDDGSPESIAIEVELKPKNLDDYKRIHKTYSSDKRIFKKVIWICSKKNTASLIAKAAEEEYNLLNDGRIDILPIETEEGVFKGNNVLALG